VNSSEPVSMNYTWSKKGTYEVRVKVQDEHGLESDLSDPLLVSIPRNKMAMNSWIQRLLEQIPYSFQILRYFFKL